MEKSFCLGLTPRTDDGKKLLFKVDPMETPWTTSRRIRPGNERQPASHQLDETNNSDSAMRSCSSGSSARRNIALRSDGTAARDCGPIFPSTEWLRPGRLDIDRAPPPPEPRSRREMPPAVGPTRTQPTAEDPDLGPSTY